MRLEFWFQQVGVEQEVYIYPNCNFESRIHGRYKRFCIAVANFSHGPLLLLKWCGCELLIEHGGLAMMFCSGHQIAPRH